MRRTENLEKRIINGVFLLSISAIAVKLLGLIYKIPLSYILSDEGMGYFNSAYTVYTFFYVVCTAGVPKAISILVSRSEAEGDSDKTAKIYKTAFSLFLGIGIIASVVLLLFSTSFAEVLKNSKSALSMMLIAPSVMFVCATGVMRGYFSGILKMLPIALSEIISGIGRLIFGLLFAYIGYILDMPAYMISALTVLGTTLASVISYLVLWIFIKKQTPRLVARARREGSQVRGIIRELFSILIPLTLTSSIGALATLLDAAVVLRGVNESGFSEYQANILYGNYTTLAVPMLNLVMALISPLTAVMLPVVTKLYTEGDRVKLNEKINALLSTTGFISIPIAFAFFFSSTDLLSILFEDTSAILAAPLLSLLAPSVVFISFTTIINTVLEGMGNTRLPLLSLCLGTLLKVILSMYLIPRIGMTGAPIASSIGYTLAFLTVYLYLRINKGVAKGVFLSFIYPTLSASLGILPYVYFRRQNNDLSLIKTLTLLLIFALIYILMYTPVFLKNKKARIYPSKLTKKVKLHCK